VQLLREAGWEVRNERLVNIRTGEPMTAEFLANDPTVERFILFYKPALERLGMTVTVRTVDASQYGNRVRSRDYDIIIGTWLESLAPGDEQRDFWGSKAASEPGSQNLVGIKNRAVDKLVDRVVFAKNREELVAATHALDRVLLWNNYVVPEWTYPYVRTARWDRFSHPDVMPIYGLSAFPNLWWWNAAKAANTGGRQ
jgi:microcin C transport system substrate-binding protein